MNQELRAKMDNLCHHMTELSKELRNDPSRDAAFCSTQVGTALGNLQMHVCNQWGVTLKPVQMKDKDLGEEMREFSNLVPNGYVRLPGSDDLTCVVGLNKTQKTLIEQMLTE